MTPRQSEVLRATRPGRKSASSAARARSALEGAGMFSLLVREHRGWAVASLVTALALLFGITWRRARCHL